MRKEKRVARNGHRRRTNKISPDDRRRHSVRTQNNVDPAGPTSTDPTVQRSRPDLDRLIERAGGAVPAPPRPLDYARDAIYRHRRRSRCVVRMGHGPAAWSVCLTATRRAGTPRRQDHRGGYQRSSPDPRQEVRCPGQSRRRNAVEAGRTAVRVAATVVGRPISDRRHRQRSGCRSRRATRCSVTFTGSARAAAHTGSAWPSARR